MSDSKRDSRSKERQRKEETVPDRPGSPLPSITAPRFSGREGNQVVPEASVTSPSPPAPPGSSPDERIKPKTELDPSAYATSGADELASEFQSAGKELDARGKLVSLPHHNEHLPEPERIPILDDPESPSGISVPAAPLEVEFTEAPKPKRPASRPPPDPPGPPVKEVAGQRSAPGRWILTPQGPMTTAQGQSAEQARGAEPAAPAEPAARRPQTPVPPAPVPDPEPPTQAPLEPRAKRGRSRRPVAIAGAAVVVLVAIAGAAAWIARTPLPAPVAVTPPPAPVPPPPATQPTGDPKPSAVTRLKVTSRPSGAAVHINGMSFGTTPVDRESPFAPEAELEIEVTHKGHRPWTKTFPGGQDVTTHAQLKPGR